MKDQILIACCACCKEPLHDSRGVRLREAGKRDGHLVCINCKENAPSNWVEIVIKKYPLYPNQAD